jgi:hypothetical protein
MLEARVEDVNGIVDTDEDFLRECGGTDVSKCSLVPGSTQKRIMPAKFPKLEVAEQDDECRDSSVRSLPGRSCGPSTGQLF